MSRAPETGHMDSRAHSWKHRLYRWRAVQRGMTRAGHLYQALLVARATDITVEVTNRTSLVIAPHPDDETLACGATIARKVEAGTSVRVMIVADGRHANPSQIITPEELASIRVEEALNALWRLGLDRQCVSFLGIEDTKVDRHEDTVVAALRDELDAFRPDEVLIPAVNDGHVDHQAVNRAARRALQSSGSRAVVLEYPVWFWTFKAWMDSNSAAPAQAAQLLTRPLIALGRLRPCLVACQPYLEAKRHALQAHRSQLHNLTGEPSWPTMDAGFLHTFLKPYELFLADPRPRAGDA